MIITITGKPGSGKSTIAKTMEKRYNITRFSMGDMFKAEAGKRNMSSAEFAEFRLKDPSFDIYMDKQIPKFIEDLNAENVVFESRVAWHFLPDSFKVFVDLDVDEIARRLIVSERTGKEKYSSFEDAKKATISRMNADNLVYKNLYNIDCGDLTNYDFVINGFGKTPEQLADKIWKECKKFYKTKQ